jgi:hypothetical protein
VVNLHTQKEDDPLTNLLKDLGDVRQTRMLLRRSQRLLLLVLRPW